MRGHFIKIDGTVTPITRSNGKNATATNERDTYSKHQFLSALGTQKHMCCSRSPPKIMQFEDFIWRDKTAQWIREIKHVSNNICISNDCSLSGKFINSFDIPFELEFFFKLLFNSPSFF